MMILKDNCNKQKELRVRRSSSVGRVFDKRDGLIVDVIVAGGGRGRDELN